MGEMDESLGLPPEMAGSLRRRGLLSRLASIGPEEGGPELTGGSERQPRLAQMINQNESVSSFGDPGTPAPESTYSANGNTRLVDKVQIQNRIEDDRTRHAQGGRSLREQMDAGDYSGLQFGNQEKQPDHLSQLQSEYDKLGQPRPPMKTWQKIALAASAPFGGLQGFVQQRNLQDERTDRQRGQLLTQIEAERRMQEQEGLADKRMTLQEQMQSERERAAQESQGRLFGQQNQLEATREQARQSAAQQAQQASEQRLSEQMRASDERQSRQFGEQEKLEGMREGARDRQQQEKGRLSVQKRIDAARDVDALEREQQQILEEVEKPEKEGGGQRGWLGGGPYMNGPQSMQFLANHMALTVGRIKGARTGKDLIEAHIQARDLDQGTEALAQRILAGGVLTHEQAKQMLGTTGVKRASAWRTVQDTADDYGVDVSDRIPKEYGGTWEPLKNKISAPGGGAPGPGKAKYHYAGSKGEIFSDDGQTWYDAKGRQVGK
jgi:hypothetical protein